MQLNHLPISFSNQEFSGFSIPYENDDQLKKLRSRLHRTHFVLRDSNRILLFPYEENTRSEGEKLSFDIINNFSVANALARQALLRSFFNNNRSISGLRPVKFVNILNNLLKHNATELFAIYPEYSFDIRPLAPQEGSFINGVVVNFGARLIIRPNASELLKQGCDLRGLYAVTESDVDNPYVIPMFSRRLAGRIDRIENNEAILVDARQACVPIDQLHIEPNLRNIEQVGRRVLGSKYDAFQREFSSCLYDVTAANKQLERLKKIATTFRDLQGELLCCSGLTVSLEGRLTEIERGIGVARSRNLNTPECSLRPGGSITVKWPVDPQIDINGPYDANSFERKTSRIAVIYPAEHKGYVQKFIAQLRDGVNSSANNGPMKQGMIRKYRLQSMDFEFIEVKNNKDKASDYRQAALEAAQNKIDAALLILTKEDKLLSGAYSPYYAAKSTLMSQGVPVQAVLLETILKNDIAYSLNNIALALYAKLGGIPWTLSVQQRLVHEIVVGIGCAQIGFDRLSDRERLIGITTVFSGDGNYLLGNASSEASSDQYQTTLLESLRTSLNELKRRFGWQEGDKLRIIFHQSFKRYKQTEADAVASLISELTEFDVEYAFVHISNDHNWKLFDESAQGTHYGQKRKGVGVPSRGQIVPLGPKAALVTLVGPQQLKTNLQGCPTPILVSVDQNSTFDNIDYIAKQVFDLTFMSWRNVMPSTKPVSISYPNLVVNLLGELRQIPNFNPDVLITKLRESRWFL